MNVLKRAFQERSRVSLPCPASFFCVFVFKIQSAPGVEPVTSIGGLYDATCDKLCFKSVPVAFSILPVPRTSSLLYQRLYLPCSVLGASVLLSVV